MAKFFYGNSLRVKVVSCFRRKAPSLMFDGILNLTLRRRFPPLGYTGELLFRGIYIANVGFA